MSKWKSLTQSEWDGHAKSGRDKIQKSRLRTKIYKSWEKKATEGKMKAWKRKSNYKPNIKNDQRVDEKKEEQAKAKERKDKWVKQRKTNG